MTDTIRRADYYYTKVKDSPGEAYRLLSHLKEKGVNLTVFSAFPAEGGMAQVDFVDLLRKVSQTIQRQVADNPAAAPGAPAGGSKLAGISRG